MRVANAQTVGAQVLEALGLPTERCAGFTISFQPCDVVRVEATYHPDEGAMTDLIKIIRTLKPAE